MRVVAVHGGVGFSADLSSQCADCLRRGGNAVDAVARLEQEGSFNCGVGSNLNWEGEAECEASYCDSEGNFGSVGAVSCTRMPVLLAQAVAMNHLGVQGLIPPMTVVGQGADDYCRAVGVPMCSADELITARTQKSWEKARRQVEEGQRKEGDGHDAEERCPSIEDCALDTVGAVEIEDDARSIACCSSGGVSLKRRGRLGHAPSFGAAVWAEHREHGYEQEKVAVSVSGLGEAIVRCGMARGLAESLLEREEDALPSEVVLKWLDRNFTRGKWLRGIAEERLLAGGIVLLSEGGHSELLIFHNTPRFPVAYADARGRVRAVCARALERRTFAVMSVAL